MKKLTMLRCWNLAMATMATLAMGCTTTETKQLPDHEPDAFAPEQGQESVGSAAAYPEGPTGWQVGNTIVNLKFVGYADFSDQSLQGLQFIELAHFYNPTGTGTFPADFAYKPGQPIPKAINLLTSAQWCGPCQYEAASVLPGLYDKYKPLGGHFLTCLMENLAGKTAGFEAITQWATKYPISYSLVVDPSKQVMAYFEAAFPSNMIIRTKDMKIVKITTGVPEKPHWAVFDKVLNDEFIPGVD